MLTNIRSRGFSFYMLVVFVVSSLAVLSPVRMNAQTTEASIVGTVTDTSGAAIPDAAIRTTNMGTGAVQNAVSDSQGRFRVQLLPVGQYEVQTEKPGFQTIVRKGVTLSVGSDAVVDFSLPVGQVTQTVTVQGELSQVDTTSSQISTLVDQTQIRELPLNGRNFEQLVLLVPGVTVMQAQTLSPYLGFGNEFSISGSRSNGQGEYLDGTDIQSFQQHGSGSGVLGTTLGVDAIAEFQVLTNTYGAQFGGNGGVVNSVSRSGTNAYHGSAYEFLRNSALDARNFFDPPNKPAFHKNQFGATFGGPIKKDKMFFFINYEGVRQSTGLTRIAAVPDANAHLGLLPCTTVATCAGLPLGSLQNFGPGSANAAKFATVKPFLDFWNQYPIPTSDNLTASGLPSGVGNTSVVATSPGREDYAVGRYDWSMTQNNSLFVRYLFDDAHLIDPFYGGGTVLTGWPADDRTRNQFVTVEQKHIWSSNVINTSRFGFTKTLVNSFTTQSYLSPDTGTNIMQFSGPNLYAAQGYPPMDGSITISGLTGVPGAGQIDPFSFIQLKYSGAEEIFWSHGAHSLRFGASVADVHSDANHPFPGGGTWQFASLQAFLQGNPTQYNGPALAVSTARSIPTRTCHSMRHTNSANMTSRSTPRTIGRSVRVSRSTSGCDMNLRRTRGT